MHERRLRIRVSRMELGQIRADSCLETVVPGGLGERRFEESLALVVRIPVGTQDVGKRDERGSALDARRRLQASLLE